MFIKKVLVVLMLLTMSFAADAQQRHQDRARSEDGQRPQHAGQGAERGHGGNGQMMMSRVRHHFVRDNGVPETYQGLTSPLLESTADMEAAKLLYDSNCSVCHGEQGLGDGVQGAGMDPAPTNIARFAKMRMAKDDYLLWTISEGGLPVSSGMPAFKDALSKDNIWQIIAYLRQL